MRSSETGSIRRSPNRRSRSTTISSSPPPSKGYVSTTCPSVRPWTSATSRPRRCIRRVLMVLRRSAGAHCRPIGSGPQSDERPRYDGRPARSVRAHGGAREALAAGRRPPDAVALALAVRRAQRIDAGARGPDVGQPPPALLARRVDLDPHRGRLPVLAHQAPQDVGSPVVLDGERQPERLVGRLLAALAGAQAALEAGVAVELRGPRL